MTVLIDYTGGAFAANKAQKVGTITGSDVDASTGNYFAYTPTADTTFTFSNAPASGTATGFATLLMRVMIVLALVLLRRQTYQSGFAFRQTVKVCMSVTIRGLFFNTLYQQHLICPRQPMQARVLFLAWGQTYEIALYQKTGLAFI
jgi:hypothetical protein